MGMLATLSIAGYRIAEPGVTVALFVYGSLLLGYLTLRGSKNSEQRKKDSESWKALKSELRSSFPTATLLQERSSTRLRRLSGTVDSIAFQLEKSSIALRITVTLPAPWPVSIWYQPQSPSAVWLSRSDWEYAWFEAPEIGLKGNHPLLLLGTLTDEVSQRLRRFVLQENGQIAGNRLICDRFNVDETVHPAQLLESVLELARLLSSAQIFQDNGLMKQLRHSRDSSLRHLALRGLLNGSQPAYVVKTALRFALQDASPRVRFLAAEQAEPDAAFPIDSQVALSLELPPEMAAMALARLPRRFGQRSLPVLQKALDLHVAGPALLATLDGLVQLEAADVDARLLARLQEVTDLGEKRRLILALGALGSVASVEHLLPYTSAKLWKASTPAFEIRLKDEAERAIRAIQSRLAGAGAGRLTLFEAPETTGALSLAEQPGGLSLAPPTPPDQPPFRESLPESPGKKPSPGTA